MSFQKKHWENVYETKTPLEVSWTQAVPEVSLQLIHQLQLPKDAAIIDVGGGDGNLVDFLLEDGYTNITVLDISEKALDKAKERLGEKANKVTWVVCDITDFNPKTTYDLWHDRATFHFLTAQNQQAIYRELLQKANVQHLIVGTFSEEGPEKCSGLTIQQYSEQSLTTFFEPDFRKVVGVKHQHTTPFQTKQQFIFAKFSRA